MVFQDYALFPHMTVRDNVAYGLKVAKVSGAERTTRRERDARIRRARQARRALAESALRRAAAARRGGARPRPPATGPLLLDEPLSNLDAKLREQLRFEMRALQRRLGMTFVVTHDQEGASSPTGSRETPGKVEQHGAPWEIYYHPGRRPLPDRRAATCRRGHINSADASRRRVGRTAQRARRRRSAPAGRAPWRAAGKSLRHRAEGASSGIASGDHRRDGVRVRRRAPVVKVDDREWIVDQPESR